MKISLFRLLRVAEDILIDECHVFCSPNSPAEYVLINDDEEIRQVVRDQEVEFTPGVTESVLVSILDENDEPASLCVELYMRRPIATGDMGV